MGDEKPAGTDVLIPVAVQEDGSTVAVHVGGDEPRLCRLTQIEEGESLVGKHAVIVTPVGPIALMETLYDGRGPSPDGPEKAGGQGPEMVNSSSFRSGWDAVFGSKGSSELN